MKQLLYKEFKLALHPTAVIFLALSAMLLIPNYPYYVTFFYTCLGVFFICLNGRENRDIYYSMLLPIRKRQIVKARFLMVVALQLAQAVLAVPFAILRGRISPLSNLAGMDANISFFGVSFLLLGLFNWVFFTRYYRDTEKVGAPFVWGSALYFLLMLLAESTVHFVPFMRDVLDTPDPAHLTAKLAVLGGGAALYALLTWLAYRRSVRSFEALDL